ncbi:UDP-N-acetylmuramate--L-alanine ligase [Thermanaeromonas sp. C210]|uniref:UDP-N-acetylmuramate--L-alanine ligase n=1 Tax=Thermanaeromonas sp. C210 TaxID=2731925 RepID=UPI00155D20C6|nr:UDP-N-acetylmuramate--L-alanine ligase [Thermanaeromonas sp. C210]GFN24075.1 UDP-N-acetylmuramate--L-alanine ligase [Thermanaeromonas sp. C210]
MSGKGWTHFIGIGGVGMSGLAQILVAEGQLVSGSDLRENRFTRLLAQRGALIYRGHCADHIAAGVERVVISSAVSPDNPEVREAQERGLPIIKRGQLLAELMERQRGIAVAGAHGKTTTTAMITLTLLEGGLDPTAVVGGYVPELGSNARRGAGPFFVAEADESDGSFLWLRPEIAVATNIEDDHLDYYGSLEAIIKAFATFLGNVKPGGEAVICADDPSLAGIAARLTKNGITYGLGEGARFQAREINLKGLGSTAKVYCGSRFLGSLELNVPGKHNVVNALAAVAVGHSLGLPFSTIQAGLVGFRGVERRFQILEGKGSIWVVDDYAHHPTEVRATLAAARQVGARRVVVVFQPHRYTRTLHLHRQLGQSLCQADLVIINEIYSAGEKPMPGVTAELIVNSLLEAGHSAVYYLPTAGETLEFLQKNCRPGDLVLTLGAGDVNRVGEELVCYLNGSGPGRGGAEG